ncbi:unannotated protein [freshwater metagenome]|uniref:Unannotated protein n=1 Tax=freshwater metagenome TaxID=449393 RepID=A0A6J7IRG6_9ZZZZ
MPEREDEKWHSEAEIALTRCGCPIRVSVVRWEPEVTDPEETLKSPLLDLVFVKVEVVA